MKYDACNHAPQAAPNSCGMLRSKNTVFFTFVWLFSHIVTAHGLKFKCRKSSVHSHYHVINVSEPAGSRVQSLSKC